MLMAEGVAVYSESVVLEYRQTVLKAHAPL